MNSDDKLFLLDAYALIYRAYYAFIKSPRINSKGFNTSAILGFVNTLEEVLKKENPTHIGVAFDPATSRMGMRYARIISFIIGTERRIASGVSSRCALYCS